MESATEIELIAKNNEDLIGKRAKFKDNLKGYTWRVWNKTGTIITHKGMPYLYLKFDEPLKTGYKDSVITNSLVICKDSIELLGEVK